MRILVAAQIIVHSPSVMCRGDAGARHHFANEFYAFAVIGPAVIGSDSFVENLACTFAAPAIALSGFWIAIEPPTYRVRCVFAHVGRLSPCALTYAVCPPRCGIYTVCSGAAS